MAKQLANAREKIERAQQHIEDKRVASQQAIERLEKEYQNMAIERRDTDKHNEELRAEADDIERKVSPLICLFFFTSQCPLVEHIGVNLFPSSLAQMADHLKRSEAELSELLAEYWALRNRTCKWTSSEMTNELSLAYVYDSRIHGDHSQEIGDAGLFGLSCCLFQPQLCLTRGFFGPYL